MTSSPVLAADIQCSLCRYNLRGLGREGACPECGYLVGASLRDHESRLARCPFPLSTADRRWLKQIREGLWLMLLAFVGTAAIAFVPVSRYSLDQHLRPIVLTVTSTLAGIGFLGLWKLSRPEPAAHIHARRSSWLTRASAIGVILTPILLTENVTNGWFTALEVIVILGSMLLSLGLLWWHVSMLLHRADRPVASFLARSLAWLQAGSVLMDMFSFRCSKGADLGSPIPWIPGGFLDSDALREIVLYAVDGYANLISISRLLMFALGLVLLAYTLIRIWWEARSAC
jgi:hypothetical protein